MNRRSVEGRHLNSIRKIWNDKENIKGWFSERSSGFKGVSIGKWNLMENDREGESESNSFLIYLGTRDIYFRVGLSRCTLNLP